MAQQGQNATLVFESAYPFVYTLGYELYGRSSTLTAAYAAAFAGLQGKRVMDIGCGPFTTGLKIAAYAPQEILAVDSSQGMIEIIQTVFLSDQDIETWLRKKNVHKLLPEFFEKLRDYFVSARREFRDGVFSRRGGTLSTLQTNSLDLNPREQGFFDVVIGNNFFHWPVNQKLAVLLADDPTLDFEHARIGAIQIALKSLASMIHPGGYIVLMEPHDFVSGQNSILDEDVFRNSLAQHPVCQKLEDLLNNFLRERHGATRTPSARTPLFDLKEMPSRAQSCGLILKKVIYNESVNPGNPLDFYVIRPILVLGSLPLLSFEAKLDLTRDVISNLKQTLSHTELTTPIREQCFFFIFQKL